MNFLNLMPHREWALQRQLLHFKLAVAGALALGAGLALAYVGWLQMQLSSTQAKNTSLQTEITIFEGQIKDIARMELEIATLKTRQQAVQALQLHRNQPVRLLSELARLMPEGAYLLSVRQDKDQVKLHGVAQSSERVSELLRALGSSTCFTQPELVEIVAATATVSPRIQRRLAHFTLHVKLLPSPESARL